MGDEGLGDEGRQGDDLRADRIALTILALSTAVRLLAAASVGPSADEAYYYAYSLHPAWGYFDHPPLVAVVAGIGRWLIGCHHPVVLRLGTVLVFTVTLAGIYTLTRRTFGRRAALFAIVLPHATPYFLLGAGTSVLPDNALCAAWVWALVLAARLRDRDIPRTLGFALLGLLCGLALLAKYHAVLLPASFVVATLYDRELRSWWRDPRLYFAGGVALLVFSPCILWNAQNEWISFAEQFGKTGSRHLAFRLDRIGTMVGGQLAYLTPWGAVVLWLLALRRTTGEGGGRWLLAFFLVPVAAFAALGVIRVVLPHWTMPGYLAAFVLAAGGLGGLQERTSRRWHKWIAAGVSVNLVLAAALVLHARVGFLPLPSESDPTVDDAGWLAAIESLEASGELAEDDVIFVHKWFTGGQVLWADRNRHPVVHLDGWPHMFAWWHPAPAYQGRSGVFITQARYGLNDQERHEILEQFRNARPLVVPRADRGQQTMRMQAWRVDDLIRPRAQPYGPMSHSTR